MRDFASANSILTASSGLNAFLTSNRKTLPKNLPVSPTDWGFNAHSENTRINWRNDFHGCHLLKNVNGPWVRNVEKNVYRMRFTPKLAGF
jgi:hypothetical protein